MTALLSTQTSGRLLETDPSLPILHVSVGFASGSILDPEGKEGATRLMLRLARRTAGARSGGAADELLDGLGASLTAEAGRSVAALHGSVIARNQAPFLDFFEDVLARPSFDANEFQRLRDEVQAELREVLDDDGALVRRAFERRFFRGHPFGRAASGTLESIARLEIADLERQRDLLARRGSLLIGLAGAATPEQLDAFVARIDAALPPGSAVARPLLPEAAPPLGRILHFVDKPERTQTQIMMGCLGTHPWDVDHTALYMAHLVFGGTFGARLSQEVRAKRGWSYGAYSALPIDRARGAFTLWTFPQAADAASCIRLEIELLEKLVDKGISQRELDSSKRYLENSHVFSIDTAQKRLALQFEAQLLGLPPGYHEGFLDRIRALTKEDVNAALRARITPQNLLIGIVGTQKDIGAQVEAAIPGLAASETVAFDRTE